MVHAAQECSRNMTWLERRLGKVNPLKRRRRAIMQIDTEYLTTLETCLTRKHVREKCWKLRPEHLCDPNSPLDFTIDAGNGAAARTQGNLGGGSENPDLEVSHASLDAF